MLNVEEVRQPESAICCKLVCQQGDSTRSIWTFHSQRFLTVLFKVKGMLRRNIDDFLKSRIYEKLGFSEIK